MKNSYCDPINNSAPKKILFIHSGSSKKYLAFETAFRIGVEPYLLHPGPGWGDDYACETFYTRDLPLSETLQIAEESHQKIGFNGVATFWEEDVPTCALIAERLELPGNTPRAAINARSKYAMRRALQQADVPVPRFHLITSERSLLQTCRKLTFPVVLKPEWGADSEWVTLIRTEDDVSRVFRRVKDLARVQNSIYPYPENRFLIEKYMRGPEVSVEGVVSNGHVTIYAIIDKAKMDDESFIERGETTPSQLPPSVQEDVSDMVRRGVHALGLTNSGVHAEIKITPSGPRIVEIGARMGGDCIQPLVKRVYGIDLVEENIKVAFGMPPSAPRVAAGFGLSGTLVPNQPGRLQLMPIGFSKIPKNVIEIVVTKQNGDHVLTPPLGYDNLAWISVWGRSYRSAKKNLSEYMARVAEACIIHPQNMPHTSDMMLTD